MSDGAPAAAPAAAPASTTGTAGAANSNAETKAPGVVGEVKQEKAWGDDDDKELFERLKRSPYKTKFKGQERGIESKDAMKEFLGHAQRGIGASKVVEETKVEREAAAKERAEATRERELLKRAKSGDWQARKELGLLDPREEKARNDEWEAVPPEVRELYEDRQRLQTEHDRLKQQIEAREQEETDRREATAMGQAKRTAMTVTNRVLNQIGMTEQNSERLMPFVAGAIADLRESGLEIGVDMPEDLILHRFHEMVGEFNEEMFGGMKLEKSMPMLEKQLKRMDDTTLLKALSPEMAHQIARAVAKQFSAKRAAASVTSPLTRTSTANDNHEDEKVLPLHRWTRR